MLFSFVSDVNVQFEDHLGIVDIYPSNESAVVYISEADLVSKNSYKRKLVQLRRVSSKFLF